METTTYRLTGITPSRSTCDHCGRTLTRLFRLTANDGAMLTVGRICSAKLTGYSWTVAQAEAAERKAQRAATAATRYGTLYTDATAAAARHTAQHGHAGVAGDVVGLLEDGGDETTARQWLNRAA